MLWPGLAERLAQVVAQRPGRACFQPVVLRPGAGRRVGQPRSGARFHRSWPIVGIGQRGGADRRAGSPGAVGPRSLGTVRGEQTEVTTTKSPRRRFEIVRLAVHDASPGCRIHTRSTGVNRFVRPMFAIVRQPQRSVNGHRLTARLRRPGTQGMPSGCEPRECGAGPRSATPDLRGHKDVPGVGWFVRRLERFVWTACLMANLPDTCRSCSTK